MGQAVAKKDDTPAAVLEKVTIGGDLSPLTTEERVEYYAKVCESLGLNPLTKPFDYIKLSGKLVLYATRGATDQLRNINNVSVYIIDRQTRDGVYVVTASATMPDGRTDESTGAVATENLRGEALANATMKAETKAKRRVTLSICGLGWLDETETETVPGRGPHIDAPQRPQRVDYQPEPPAQGEDFDEQHRRHTRDVASDEIEAADEPEAKTDDLESDAQIDLDKLVDLSGSAKSHKSLEKWLAKAAVQEMLETLPNDKLEEWAAHIAKVREALDNGTRQAVRQ